ncbi:tetrapyrrole biosynthesis, uroporphyrinogen III synthase [Chiua virens]|nr:tetrapyrrole biosynthesis, uroporphyrinogen III synthase [Chiua virens]
MSPKLIRRETGPIQSKKTVLITTRSRLRRRGIPRLSVPVLETTFVNIDVLADEIVRGPNALGISGVILTSKRAIEAWHEALRSISPEVETTQADWRTVTFYVVGHATARAASEMHTAFPTMVHLAPAEGLIRGGAGAGTAERLAAFILAEGVGGNGLRMLYLTGDKNREAMPEMLSAGGVVLDTLEAYRTTGSSAFRADLGTALEKVPATGTDPTWVVHFAPSAAAFVTPFLREVLSFDGEKLKVAAIGGTTAAHLSDTLKVRVDVGFTQTNARRAV